MTREEVLLDFTSRFNEDILDFEDKSNTRVYVQIKSEAIVRIGTYLFRNIGARFNIASATDLPPKIEILYHFIIEDINLLISLRVFLDREKPEIESLAKEIEAFNWIEREMNELLGITFIGHPDPRRLLLADNWPEGVYPLRQDYEEWDEKADRTRGL
ncbi:MAG: NADH-quinone oxidoreductase subunit C [Candidatus Aegiribacteria sp.]|nr:NADH-quinone oxidoreductase subunit C [Candidatus Aegiribacteria sp.]